MTQQEIIQLLKRHYPNRYTARQLSKFLNRNRINISRQLQSLRHFGFVNYQRVVMVINKGNHAAYIYWHKKTRKKKQGNTVLNEICVVNYLKKHRVGSAKSISREVNLSYETILKILKSLNKQNAIKQVRKSKHTKYYKL